MKLPDLATASVEKALNTHWYTGGGNRLVKENGRNVRVESFESILTENSTLDLPDVTEKESGFQLLSRLIVERVLGKDPPRDLRAGISSLVEMIQLRDDDFGPTEEERKVTRALRWEAALALRAMPLDQETREALQQIALTDRDEVLRGALAGAMVALKPGDEFVRTWLAHESSDRALQAVLVEFQRLDWVDELSEKDSVEEKNGEIIIEGSGTSSVGRPRSGVKMGQDLAWLIERLRLLQGTDPGSVFNRVEDSPKPASSKQTRESQSSPDAVSMAIEALVLRMDSGLIPQVEALIEQTRNPRLRSGLLEALGSVGSPQGEEALLRCAFDVGRSSTERTATFTTLSEKGSDAAVAQLQKLLWDKDEQVRVGTAQTLAYRGVKLSAESVAQLKSLVETTTDTTARIYYSRLLQKAK